MEYLTNLPIRHSMLLHWKVSMLQWISSCMIRLFLSKASDKAGHMALVSAAIDKMLLNGTLCFLSIENGKYPMQKTKEFGMYQNLKTFYALSTIFKQSTKPISYGVRHMLRWIGSVKSIEYKSESYNPFHKSKNNNLRT